MPSASMSLGPIGRVDPMLPPPRRGAQGPPSPRPSASLTLPLYPPPTEIRLRGMASGENFSLARSLAGVAI
eukprot:3127556-Pleurochrysis_carterae.AAC.1